ncbi:MAG: hypothetical protein K0S47_4672 [Herbinix sp.]|jgi:outer membrane lipoprotein-sorting protein|nr:hypothetical protein [Herbinix sp.]
MDKVEKRLSEYIDQLNDEKTPMEHRKGRHSSDYEKFLNTVRMVKSLKEPEFPKEEFEKRLTDSIQTYSDKDLKEKSKSRARLWMASLSAAAAVIAMVLIVNAVLPNKDPNMIHAMEQAITKLQAYNGILEIVETNELGEEVLQTKREVWADQEGNYYVKEIVGNESSMESGMVTVNNGELKWQIYPEQKKVYQFAAFPDSYHFTFKLGREVDNVKNALNIKILGEDLIAGRGATILEITPDNGVPYRLWVDKETDLPLQRESAMQNALKYRVTYTDITFTETIPKGLLTYSVPEDYEIVAKSPEQFVSNITEAEEMAGLSAIVPDRLPDGYSINKVSVETNTNTIKMYYRSTDHIIVLLQSMVVKEFQPASGAILGSISGNTVEVLISLEGKDGTFTGGGAYESVTGVASIRFQNEGIEYTIIGSDKIDTLKLLAENITNEELLLPEVNEDASEKPVVEVSYDLEEEKNAQKSVDEGHSPWRLDPAFVAQVYVSLLISPEGIVGDYPIAYEDITITANDGVTAIAEIKDDKSPAGKVYLKRLARQDKTGIWTVVGYAPR